MRNFRPARTGDFQSGVDTHHFRGADAESACQVGPTSDPLTLARIVVVQDVRSANAPPGARLSTDSDLHTWVGLKVSYEVGHASVLGDYPQRVALQARRRRALTAPAPSGARSSRGGRRREAGFPTRRRP